MRRFLQSAALLLFLLPAIGCDSSGSSQMTPPTEGEKQEIEEAESQMAKEIQKANARRRP